MKLDIIFCIIATYIEARQKLVDLTEDSDSEIETAVKNLHAKGKSKQSVAEESKKEFASKLDEVIAPIFVENFNQDLSGN